MSWAEEDWTVGLSGRVLQKVKELQVHQERLSRENKQKQLQLDNIHTSLEKQTIKYEEVRAELQSVHRELQRVQEEAKAAVTSRERLTQELQTKQAQVCSFEGQLDAARTLNNKLTQEIKRLEVELEKLQNSSRSADTTLFSTPCWNTASPWEHNGSRKEERSGYRDEGQSRVPNSRRLQFSDLSTPSLPQAQKNTPHRHPSDQSDSFSTPSAAFPWERDDSRQAARRRSPSSPQAPCADVSRAQSEQGVCGKEKDYRKETDMSLLALRTRVSALEEEVCVKAATMKSIQNEMAQSKKELAARELSIQRTRDELSLAHTRMAQESERASGAEQRLKQLQEELKCQRQNAESSRLQHQQRSKDLEKQHQRDLTELQKERQCLEKQHQQEVNKLNQELQQARTLHNALQAQVDKLTLQKQSLDKELDTLKEKVKWTQGQLQESQKKEAQTQAKLMEAVREAEGVAVSLEQSRKKERTLEEEGRRLAQERADALQLVKELQEQKVAPPAQPVQFCPIGPSFSPPPHLRRSQPQTQVKSTAANTAERKREETAEKRRVEVTSSYPSDREPGEGIDSEHITHLISPDSELLQKGHRKINDEAVKNKNELIGSDSSRRSKHSTFDDALSSSSHSSADTQNNPCMDRDHCNVRLSAEKSQQAEVSEDLKRENAALRSELRDVREELQKRLDDLEAQRRAEAETRTRLKQLSRKHASQSVEKEEQDKEWRTQLEREKAETEMLRKALAAMETEMQNRRAAQEKNERQWQEEEKNKGQEDRESEMIELNIQLKKQLAEVKAQLALEREERKREEEERNQVTNTDIDEKKELSMKLEKLRAELEELKSSRKDDSLKEETLLAANSPLMYLTLHDDELNSNMVRCDNFLLPSPEQHLLFCQSTNQRNTLVSQATAGLIQEEGTAIDPERSPEVAPDSEDARQKYLIGSSLSDDEHAPSDLAKEVKRLRKENVKETERANQYQVKLEALQSQVIRQTQQLTTAFEKQSRHISGLLAELQEKESALLSQGEEVQRYKLELDTIRSQKEREETKTREERPVKGVGDGEQTEEEAAETPVLQPNHEQSSVTCVTANSLVDGETNAQGGAAQPQSETSDAERQKSVSDNEALSSEEDPGSIDSDKIQNNHDIAETERDQDQASSHVAADLLTLRRENQLLKQRILGLESSSSVRDTADEPQEVPAERGQNARGAAGSPSESHDTSDGVQPSVLQSLRSHEEAVGGLEGEDGRTEEELGAVWQAQINHLQQKVVELQKNLQVLSAENQQQSEELVLWRLASQPVPTFDLPNTDNQREILDERATLRQSQSNQQQTGEMTQSQGQTVQVLVQDLNQGVQESRSNVSVIREDKLFLSCSSNKLQGRTLFSRLQQSNTPESKSLLPSKKTSAPQQDTVEIDEGDHGYILLSTQDSEKENQEIKLIRQANSLLTQVREETDAEIMQVSSEKMCHCVTKDSAKASAPKQTKTAKCDTASPEVTPEVSRATRKMSTAEDFSGRDVRREMKSVGSQTEECCYPPAAPELHCVCTQTEEVQEEEGEEELVDSPPVSPVPPSEGAELGDKVLFSGSFPIPADPARLAERIRRNRTQLSAAFDDTEYEPYGLPEVVMKGFADIPSGPSCPYIVRRGLLGTSVVPVSQKDQGQGQGQDQEETD